MYQHACLLLFWGGEMVHAATLNQIMALAQQEKNKDEKYTGTDNSEKEICRIYTSHLIQTK